MSNTYKRAASVLRFSKRGQRLCSLTRVAQSDEKCPRIDKRRQSRLTMNQGWKGQGLLEPIQYYVCCTRRSAHSHQNEASERGSCFRQRDTLLVSGAQKNIGKPINGTYHVRAIYLRE